jgi:outer membrane lipoprotein-sorting protein
MKKFFLIFILINFNNVALSSIKENIINSLINTDNLSFNFEQNINGKVETGNCIIQYPKKMFCEYNNISN